MIVSAARTDADHDQEVLCMLVLVKVVALHYYSDVHIIFIVTCIPIPIHVIDISH